MPGKARYPISIQYWTLLRLDTTNDPHVAGLCTSSCTDASHASFFNQGGTAVNPHNGDSKENRKFVVRSCYCDGY